MFAWSGVEKGTRLSLGCIWCTTPPLPLPSQTTAGLIADCRQIVQTTRDEASNYRSEYNLPVPLPYLAGRLAQYMHAYTLYSAVRPFG